MTWIEVHDTLPDHPKVMQLAEMLHIPDTQVVGMLVCLWSWAINQRQDGRLLEADRVILSRVMRIRRKPESLLDALVAVEFLDKDDSGYKLHDWEQYAGRLIQYRRQAKERTRKARSKTALHEPYAYATHNACEQYASTVPNRTIPILEDEDEYPSSSRGVSPSSTLTDPSGMEETFMGTEEAIAAHWLAEFGSLTPAQRNNWISVWVKLYDAALICRAVSEAADRNVKNPPGYIARILRQWQREDITTTDKLDERDALRDMGITMPKKGREPWPTV